jgi:Fuc2NAc and GlcNAc transferase
VIALGAALLSTVLFCWLYLPLARRLQWLDRPNRRSAHSVPVPHGGGVAIVLGLACGMFAAWPWPVEYLLLAGLGGLLMMVGVADDVWKLSVRSRIVIYACCSLALVGQLLPDVPALALIVPAIACLWMINLYNFMDGIDGLAATQCVLACCSAALLAWGRGAQGGEDYAAFCLLLAAAQLGFLFWNWPPARLFMGDAGSVPTGLMLFGLALLGWTQGALNPACWLILLAAFIADASWTLLWRFFTGQPVTQAHSLHAYQRLSREWGSHLGVDLLLIALNALWLFPLAWAASSWPQHAWILVILAYLPLLAGMVRAGKLA